MPAPWRKMLNFRILRSDFLLLEQHAVRERTTISALIRGWIEPHLVPLRTEAGDGPVDRRASNSHRRQRPPERIRPLDLSDDAFEDLG